MKRKKKDQLGWNRCVDKKKFLLTFFNILRQPLQALKQAFPCGGTTGIDTRRITQLMYAV